MFDLVDQLAQGAAAIFFCDRFSELQSQYRRYLKALILWKLVGAMMSVPNTRDVLVIPAACYSKLKDDLFVHLDPANLQGLMLPAKDTKCRQNSTSIREDVVQKVAATLPRFRTQFQEALYRLHQEVDSLGQPGQGAEGHSALTNMEPIDQNGSC